MSDLFTDYARVVVKEAEAAWQSYPAQAINHFLMNMAPGPALLMGNGVGYEGLPVLDKALDEHMKAHYFSRIGGGKFPFHMGFLVSKARLESIREWPEWQMLHLFLFNNGLFPVIVFKNSPLEKDGVSFYPGDIRIGFDRDIEISGETPRTLSAGS